MFASHRYFVDILIGAADVAARVSIYDPPCATRFHSGLMIF